MTRINTKYGPLFIDNGYSSDDGGWYAELVDRNGETVHTTALCATEGEAGRAAVAAVPRVASRLAEANDDG